MTVNQVHGIPRPGRSPEADPSTLSNYANFQITSTNLNFVINFTSKTVSGDVTFQLTAVASTESIVLDTSYLDVHAVSVNDVAQEFTIGERTGALGSPLVISRACAVDEEISVHLVFVTTSRCTALQFLEKSATDGKKFPYLFSQSEAIHSRSLFPCFDTPALKSPYTMSVTSSLPAVMSGLPQGDGENTETVGEKVYRFTQPVPIPSYLVALASGDIQKLPVGPRSHVYCESPNLKRCQHEFDGDVEKFLEAAEKIVFGYEWKQYDVLILPTAFPYGGMEVPNVTFATPTIVTGDKSNVDVVAHELAHSWAGNLVTNCSWEHFWLNEGWCVYLERRILAEVHGDAVRDFMAIIGWYDLANAIKAMGESATRFSCLVQDLKDGSDPDDAFSVVPYEKGSTLLYYIETLLGKQKFDPFIPFYFNKFKYKSLDTYQFLDTLYDFFSDDHEVLDQINWDSWLYAPGMPPVKPDFDTTLADQCYQLAARWHTAIVEGAKFTELFSLDDLKVLDGNQSVVFLETLIAFNKQDGFVWAHHRDALEALDEIYGPKYSHETNAEVLSRWYFLQVGGHNHKFYEKLGRWLGTVGRMKFVRPGYVTLNKVDHDMAVKYFLEFESGYHPICQAMVRKDLAL
ncbi:Leucyl aminopeptidase yscIV [Yamadazyma tenuis]|uniref:Leukotriene A(4) hydrolase n=1 Tax=Candida tenuis (strain ATCC 10573 / BCRC 21748 / CBS 615 / JCM 9827 / NBRC 10315 / NRRL Y-1498 / VKM Y-70) TaxID=590646 RepID=G3AX40_CANTC|nr:uncharacterized protein CANTEDRAFT_117851 [Yamadazyma tenuis ATCC 10573]EGV66683.1 hypothetical protein CANTEDRAFT_117851 [Yamadazyma tenuis ATCC 10573]WEJ95187.1 Leucyl aminopeptidase yscIV [Yamadazyma tenuis]